MQAFQIVLDYCEIAPLIIAVGLFCEYCWRRSTAISDDSLQLQIPDSVTVAETAATNKLIQACQDAEIDFEQIEVTPIEADCHALIALSKPCKPSNAFRSRIMDFSFVLEFYLPKGRAFYGLGKSCDSWLVVPVLMPKGRYSAWCFDPAGILVELDEPQDFDSADAAIAAGEKAVKLWNRELLAEASEVLGQMPLSLSLVYSAERNALYDELTAAEHWAIVPVEITSGFEAWTFNPCGEKQFVMPPETFQTIEAAISAAERAISIWNSELIDESFDFEEAC